MKSIEFKIDDEIGALEQRIQTLLGIAKVPYRHMEDINALANAKRNAVEAHINELRARQQILKRLKADKED